jgi:hypothetical protein
MLGCVRHDRWLVDKPHTVICLLVFGDSHVSSPQEVPTLGITCKNRTSVYTREVCCYLFSLLLL